MKSAYTNTVLAGKTHHISFIAIMLSITTHLYSPNTNPNPDTTPSTHLSEKPILPDNAIEVYPAKTKNNIILLDGKDKNKAILRFTDMQGQKHICHASAKVLISSNISEHVKSGASAQFKPHSAHISITQETLRLLNNPHKRINNVQLLFTCQKHPNFYTETISFPLLRTVSEAIDSGAFTLFDQYALLITREANCYSFLCELPFAPSIVFYLNQKIIRKALTASGPLFDDFCILTAKDQMKLSEAYSILPFVDETADPAFSQARLQELVFFQKALSHCKTTEEGMKVLVKAMHKARIAEKDSSDKESIKNPTKS